MYILNTRGSSIETVALHCLTFFAFFSFDHDVVVIVYVSIKETSTCIYRFQNIHIHVYF